MKEIKSVDGMKPLSKEQKSKHEFRQLWQGFKTTCKNVENFVITVSLLIVSAYTFESAYKHAFSIQYVREALLFCSTLIGLQAAWLLWKHINHQKIS